MSSAHNDFSGAFRPHGQSEFLADGAIIRIDVEGPFNLQGMTEFGQKMQRLFADIPAGRSVVTLADVRTSLLATPEAWALLEAIILEMQGGALRVLGTAWVVAETVEGRSLLLPRAHRAYAAAGRPFAVFTDASAAEDWARERLAEG